MYEVNLETYVIEEMVHVNEYVTSHEEILLRVVSDEFVTKCVLIASHKENVFWRDDHVISERRVIVQSDLLVLLLLFLVPETHP